MRGLMQDWPMTVDRILDHADRWHGDREVISRSVEGPIVRTTWSRIHGRAKQVTHALKELGIPGFDVAIWVGLTGPRGLPLEVVAKINADARAVLRDPQVRARLVASGLEPVDSMNASEFAAFIRQDAPRWQTRVRDAGLTVD